MLQFNAACWRIARSLTDAFVLISSGGEAREISPLLAGVGFVLTGIVHHPPTGYVGARHVCTLASGGGILFVEGVSARQGFNLFTRYGTTVREGGTIRVPLPVSFALTQDSGPTGLLGLDFRKPCWLVGHSGGAAYVRFAMAITARGDVDQNLAAVCLGCPMPYASGFAWPREARAIVNLGADDDGVCSFPTPEQVLIGSSLPPAPHAPDTVYFEQAPEQVTLQESGSILDRHTMFPVDVPLLPDLVRWAGGLPGLTTSSHPLSRYASRVRAVQLNVEAAAVRGDPPLAILPLPDVLPPAVVPPVAREVPGPFPLVGGLALSVANPRFDKSYIAFIRRAGFDRFQVVWMDQVLSVFKTKAAARILVRNLNASMRRSAGARSQSLSSWVTAVTSFFTQSAVNDGRIVPPATVVP